MVDRVEPERRDTAEYGLQLVRRLANFQQVAYAGPRVYGHLVQLGYELGDACALLQQLEPEHFHQALRYSPRGPWHDVYLLPHPADDDPGQRLYIKFHVDGSCVTLTLCSMHPEGWT